MKRKALIALIVVFSAVLAVSASFYLWKLVLKSLSAKFIPALKAVSSSADYLLLEGHWMNEDGVSFSFGGGKVEFSYSEGNMRARGEVLLEEGENPKRMDVKITGASTIDYIGKTSLGIYSLEGNTLALCMGRPGERQRPDSFEDASGKAECFRLKRGSPGLPSPAMTPEEASPGFDLPESAPVTEGKEVMFYVYSLNYKGMIRLNGEELYEIKGVKDMNYNFSTGKTLPFGKNSLEAEYDSLPEAWKTELQIKVYLYDWETSREDVLAEWVLNDKGGRKLLEFEVKKQSGA